jgi:hypothetical protein
MERRVRKREKRKMVKYESRVIGVVRKESRVLIFI